MQTQTCSACRRAARSAGDGFPPLLQIWCAESPEFSARVSDREKHRQELGAAASRQRAPRAGAAGWSAQGLRPCAVTQAAPGPALRAGDSCPAGGAGQVALLPVGRCGTCHLAGGQGVS